MSDFLKKKLFMMRLQEELNALEENEQYKKQNLFLEELQGLLDKHAIGMEDLKDMLEVAYESNYQSSALSSNTGATRGRPAGTKISSHEIKYKNEIFKVNEKGRQPDETKKILDKLKMTPLDFIEEYSPHPHDEKVEEDTEAG